MNAQGASRLRRPPKRRGRGWPAVAVLLLVGLGVPSLNAMEPWYAGLSIGIQELDVEHAKTVGLVAAPDTDNRASMRATRDRARDTIGVLGLAVGRRVLLSESVYLAGELEAALYANGETAGFLPGTGSGDRDVWRGSWNLAKRFRIRGQRQAGVRPCGTGFSGCGEVPVSDRRHPLGRHRDQHRSRQVRRLRELSQSGHRELSRPLHRHGLARRPGYRVRHPNAPLRRAPQSRDIRQEPAAPPRRHDVRHAQPGLRLRRQRVVPDARLRLRLQPVNRHAKIVSTWCRDNTQPPVAILSTVPKAVVAPTLQAIDSSVPDNSIAVARSSNSTAWPLDTVG